MLQMKKLTPVCLWVVIMQKISYLRSRSSFMIHVKTALVQGFSKKQSTVETTVFGAEFVAMKQSIDAL